MVKITPTLLESRLLIEAITGEKLFDSLAFSYETSRGGGAFAQELNGLSPNDTRMILDFMKEAGYDVRLPETGATPHAIKRAITTAVASSSSSSSSSASRSEGFGTHEEDEDEEDETGVIKDDESGISVRRERPMKDDPAASELALARTLGHRSETGEED